MQVVLSSDCVDNCRACKDAEEQALMREASRINDAVNETAKHYIKAGMTEREVAEFIDAQFRAHGCEGPSFTTIVSFGANAADPHHEPDDTVLKEGDCVLFDMGCVKSRYCSDMTRTWFCGQPTEKQAAVHDLNLFWEEGRLSFPMSNEDSEFPDQITANGVYRLIN